MRANKNLRVQSLVFLLFVMLGINALQAQLFGKERLLNIENFDKDRFTWGYYLGFNNLDFKVEYFEPTEELEVSPSTGFNVGLIGDMRIHEYLNLRFEPGLIISNRNVVFPQIQDEVDRLREITSTYIYMPIVMKFSTKRLNNFKPFVTAGISTAINLSSEENNPSDNSSGQFRMKESSYFYEIGFGIDLYLYYFKFTPSIRGVFAFSDELVRDFDPNSPWTGNIDTVKT
ncbi:MAG: porin family protein, partial [Flavobacteriaceae bacterium]|nr:porin family protein [Flavobacteriaceae bacterium]